MENQILVTSIIAIIICLLAVPLHITALTLLYQLKSTGLKSSQKYLMKCLCFSEIGLCVTFMSIRTAFVLHFQKKIISVIVFIFQATVLCTMYCVVMTMITIDRFLEFRFTLKYPLICSVKKTKIIVLFFLLMATVVFLSISAKFVAASNFKNSFSHYIYLGGNSAFLVIASFTYVFIFKKLRQNRKELVNMRKRVNVYVQKRSAFKMFVPSLIIITFIIFTVIPNLIEAISYTKNVSDFNDHTRFIMYPLGWFLDPLMYIFSLKVIRKKLRRIFTQRSTRKLNAI